ncbi:MAG: SMI1/KNR4 family protein [Ferruginibacter sp.]
MTTFKIFVDRFNKSEDSKTSTQAGIDLLEKEFKIYLPSDFKTFLLHFGDIWTPGILDLVVDKESDLNDVSQFWDVEQIIYDKKNEWTSSVSVDIIPFASDCMGNIFAFLANDLKRQKASSAIYFFDHDFDTVEKIAESFTEWIDKFNQL